MPIVDADDDDDDVEYVFFAILAVCKAFFVPQLYSLLSYACYSIQLSIGPCIRHIISVFL